MSIVISLPEVLQAALLTEWLSLKEVGRLDSALCNSKLRPNFLRLLQMNICIFRGKKCGMLHPEWVLLRHAKMQEVRLSHLDETLRKAFLLHVGPFVERVLVDSDTFPHRRTHVTSIEGIATSEISKAELKLTLDDLGEHCSGMTKFEINFKKIFKVTFSEANFASMCNLISKCNRLRCLSLTWIVNLPVQFLEAISSALCLQSLQLAGCTLDKAARTSESLSLYKNTSVHNYSCHSDAAGLAAMFPSLETFAVQGLRLPSTVQLAFENCPLVTSTTLDFASFDSVYHLEIFLQGWPQLRTLIIMENGCKVAVPERAVIWLLTNYKSLTTVGKLKKNTALLCSLPNKGSSLTLLSICCNETATLDVVIAQCPCLHTLYLQKERSSAQSDSTTYVPVEKSLHLIVGTRIRVLCLSNYEKLANDNLLQLMHADLHVLRLDYCGIRTMTDNAILSLLPSMPNLSTIEIKYCHSITYEIVLQLPLLCMKLRRFTFVNRDCKESSTKSEAPELMRRMLCKLYPHVAYWHVVC